MIRTLKETYTQLFQEVQIKVETLNDYIDSQWRNAELRKELLEKLYRNRASLIARLDRIVTEAKVEVKDHFYKKAIQLDPLMLIVKLKSYYRDEMLAEMAGLSEAGFLGQAEGFKHRCDSLVSTPVHGMLADPVDCCNVSCSLLPTIEMESFSITITSKTNSSMSYVDRYGYQWNLELEIKTQNDTLPAMCMDKLMLNVQLEASGQPAGNYTIQVEIANNLPLKTITQHIQFKSYGLPKPRNISKEIANIRHLQNEGFIAKDDRLQLKIGIGPEDPITERNCYQQTLEKCQYKISSLENELTSWKKFNISHFRMEQCPTVDSKRSKTTTSLLIMDEYGVKWQLKVSINGKSHKGFLGVSLSKYNGSRGWYDYFIELIHPKSEKHNRIVRGWHLFEEVGLLELPQFVTVAFLDPFMDGATLRLRFGTRKEEE